MDVLIDPSKFKTKHYGQAIAWIVNRVETDPDQLQKDQTIFKELQCSSGKSAETIGPLYFARASTYINDPEKKYLGDDNTLIIHCEV